MRQTPNPRPNGSLAAPRSTAAPREGVAALPVRPLQSLGGIRVLQDRGAPAQRSLFQRALPAR